MFRVTFADPMRPRALNYCLTDDPFSILWALQISGFLIVEVL